MIYVRDHIKMEEMGKSSFKVSQNLIDMSYILAAV